MAKESENVSKGLLKGPIKRRKNVPVSAIPTVDYAALFQRLTRRYGQVTPDALESILCPVLIPIGDLDKTISRIKGQGHFRGSFEVKITKDNQALLVPGRTGKFVPRDYVLGGVWRELAKGRIISVDPAAGVAKGEIYLGSSGKAGRTPKSDRIAERGRLLGSRPIWRVGEGSERFSGILSGSSAEGAGICGATDAGRHG